MTGSVDAYFERVDDGSYRATAHTSGAWREDEQHVAPSLGVLVHAVEQHRDARRDDRLVVGRLSYDILGTMPVDVVEVAVEVLRPGRTIELVEATMSHAGRAAVRLRAWLMQERDTAAVARTRVEPVPGRDDVDPWEPDALWPGAFIASLEGRRVADGPGRGLCWVRARLPLLAGEPVSPTARIAGLLDVANGMNVLADPRAVAFPNVDLTAHLLREPVGEWLGIDTRVGFGPTGLGVTASDLHDDAGPLGVSSQLLTVRPA